MKDRALGTVNINLGLINFEALVAMVERGKPCRTCMTGIKCMTCMTGITGITP